MLESPTRLEPKSELGRAQKDARSAPRVVDKALVRDDDQIRLPRLASASRDDSLDASRLETCVEPSTQAGAKFAEYFRVRERDAAQGLMVGGFTGAGTGDGAAAPPAGAFAPPAGGLPPLAGAGAPPP